MSPLQLRHQTLFAMEKATLSVVSCGGCTYQWYDQNGVIAGATSSTYNTGNAGAYHVTIGNSDGCTGQSGRVIALIGALCRAPHNT